MHLNPSLLQFLFWYLNTESIPLASFIFKKSGYDVSLGLGIVITGGKSIEIGNSINIMRFSCLYSHSQGSIKIGSNVSMNTNVVIGSSDRGEVIS